jgi:hypothetical protein
MPLCCLLSSIRTLVTCNSRGLNDIKKAELEREDSTCLLWEDDLSKNMAAETVRLQTGRFSPTCFCTEASIFFFFTFPLMIILLKQDIWCFRAPKRAPKESLATARGFPAATDGR